MRKILAVAKKEVIHILRDPRSLYLNLGLPVVLLLILGYAISFELRGEPIFYVDLDRTPVTRKLLSYISQESSFSGPKSCQFPLIPLLRSGKARAILVIPHGFTKRLRRGGEATLQIILDGADNNTALITAGTLEEMLAAYEGNVQLEFLKKNGIPYERLPLNPSLKILYNPLLKSAFFIVPGLISLIMMVVSALMTAMTIAREWETGTLEKLLTSPLTIGQILIGKTLPYFVLGFIQILLILAVGRIVFDVPFRGSLIILFLFSGLFLLGGLGVGLLISVAAKTQQLAMQITWLSTILPGFLLSGFLFPIESMPKTLQAFTYLVPARYYLTILRGILLKGAGFMELWPQGLFLIAYSSVSLVLASVIFPRRIS